jgi:hypothetical protein
MFCAMTNRFGVVLHLEDTRWAAAERVSETVIAAVLLLHERSVEDIAPQLSATELEHVIELVGRSPRLYPPGTLDALKTKRMTSLTPMAARLLPSATTKEQAAAHPRPEHRRPLARPEARQGTAERPNRLNAEKPSGFRGPPARESISATATSSTPHATRNWHRRGSRTFSATDPLHRLCNSGGTVMAKPSYKTATYPLACVNHRAMELHVLTILISPLRGVGDGYQKHCRFCAAGEPSGRQERCCNRYRQLPRRCWLCCRRYRRWPCFEHPD